MSAPLSKSFSSPLHNVQRIVLAVRPASVVGSWVSRGHPGNPLGRPDTCPRCCSLGRRRRPFLRRGASWPSTVALEASDDSQRFALDDLEEEMEGEAAVLS